MAVNPVHSGHHLVKTAVLIHPKWICMYFNNLWSARRPVILKKQKQDITSIPCKIESRSLWICGVLHQHNGIIFCLGLQRDRAFDSTQVNPTDCSFTTLLTVDRRARENSLLTRVSKSPPNFSTYNLFELMQGNGFWFVYELQMKESTQVGHKNPCCVKTMRTAPFNQIYRYSIKSSWARVVRD